MAKYIFINPALSTLNRGDEIISEACKENLKTIINESDFIIDICSHLPVLNYYLNILGETKKTFVLGSNLLGGKMNRHFKQWYILPHNVKALKNIILMGAGWRVYNESPNFYTRILYRKLLNNGNVHSVRDEYTKKMLESIGIKNVINTGCPTMWCLTKDHCNQIPTHRCNTVVFTLTDYSKDKEIDVQLIETLKMNYNMIYYWIQGSGDEEYLRSLPIDISNIQLINPTLKAYEEFLENNECDYIGTRLHAGIKALQCKKRSIIIGIDNRALELHKDYNIPVLDKKNMDKLNGMINSEFKTEVIINEEAIKNWLSQINAGSTNE